MSSLAEAKNVAIQVRANESLTVWADAEKLLRVLFNLVDNALKFSPAGQSSHADSVTRGQSDRPRCGGYGHRDFRRTLAAYFRAVLSRRRGTLAAHRGHRLGPRDRGLVGRGTGWRDRGRECAGLRYDIHRQNAFPEEGVNLDWNLFVAINSLAGHSLWLDAAGSFLAEDAFLLFGLLLVALWFLPGGLEPRRARQVRVANVTLVPCGCAALCASHRPLLYRPRPFITHAVTQLISHPPDSSFPSDHTALAFSLVVALWPVLGGAQWFWLAWGVLIGLARVFVGVHFPTDVLGGAILGAAWGGLALILSPRLARVEAKVLDRLARWRMA